MNSERWQKVKGLFDVALELAPAKREKFLDKSCGNDDDLRREVEKLLDSFADDSFMEQPAVAEVASVIIKADVKNLEAGKCFGHYEIVRQIGAGGMGEVYLAQDKKLDRLVAVKILNETFAKHESNLRRFTQEAKAASALNHPNILVIHEIGEAEDAHYIVSEFVEGRTLREHFKESLIKLSEVLEISIQIANALCAAHGAHIVHRDIKPENIMIRSDGYAKILDFGLAKLVEQKAVGLEDATVKQNQTAKGIVLGTVNYMSPEQAKGERVDARTDVFSLGIVIYEMMAGRTPFAGNTMSETFANLINAEPQPLARYAEGVPDEMQRIVSKTLRKNKDKRYQTMENLLADLKDLREDLAFDERLEKLHSPNDKNATAILQAATGDVNGRTGETNYNSTGQIKRQKSFAVFTLAVLLIAAIGFSYYFLSARKPSSSTGDKKSLAVLPFVNASQDPNAEYLSDGITESVINNLSQLAGLKVMSRNSAFRFKNNQSDTRNIASQLGVESLVTGDIKQLGDRLIINVRLIDGRDDSQIWGNQYVKTTADVITTQNEIAQAVAQNLRLKLTNSEQQQLDKNYTKNVEAYRLYLKGRYHLLKLTPPEMRKSIEFFQQAIDVDPAYALAYVGVADVYRLLPITSDVPPQEAFPKAKAALSKALEIDETLAEAHSSLGSVKFWFDWDWRGAETEFRRSIELNSNNANARPSFAHFLSNMGRFDEALAESRKAREIDPLSLTSNALEGLYLFYANRDDEAIARLRETIEIEPRFWVAHINLAKVYVRQKRFEEAITELNLAKEFSGGSTETTSLIGYALAISGKREQAQTALDELKKLQAQKYVPSYNIAMICNGLDEKDETFAWLEKAYDERDVRMTFLKVDPKWDKLRSDSRFASLVKRMNFE